MTDLYSIVGPFMGLFKGLDEAYGTGAGSWVRSEPGKMEYLQHLQGEGAGLGIAPLMRDNRINFGAIDLDEPDFEAAREMQNYIPGTSWVERSRSGNAHVWVFFSESIEAWIVRGILKEAIQAANKGAVEVFPKQDRLLEGMVGNYINLPYFGDTRPILSQMGGMESLPVEEFVAGAQEHLNDPRKWRKRAAWLQIVAPEERKETSEFGTGRELHICAEHIVANCEDNPVVEGTRNAVYFALAKQFSHYAGFNHDEAWDMMLRVNNASPDKAPLSELRRILYNAERGQYTSTDCDNPLVTPYCHPDCPIAHPEKKR